MNNNQSGIAHPVVLGLIVAVVAVVGFAGWRVANNDKTLQSQNVEESAEIVDELPNDLEGIKTIEEVEAILGLSDDSEVLEYRLETKDGVTFYVLELTNGKEIKVDANTGEIISDDDSNSSSDDDSDDDKYNDNDDDKDDDKDDDSSSDKSSETKVEAKLTAKEAYVIAASRHSSPVKEIELEREDDKATYKIEYADGSKIEINAVTGAVVKLDIKDDSSSDDDDEVENESEDEE